MLNFWEKDFDQSINKHISFLNDNIENQSEYCSSFSEILQKMDIFQTEDTEDSKEENQPAGQDNPHNEDEKRHTFFKP